MKRGKQRITICFCHIILEACRTALAEGEFKRAVFNARPKEQNGASGKFRAVFSVIEGDPAAACGFRTRAAKYREHMAGDYLQG